MIRKHRLTILTLVAIAGLAVGLNASGLVLAQAPSQLTSSYVTQVPPLADPYAPLWDAVPYVELPLIAQAGVPPTLPETSISAVRLRSVNNGQWVSFLVEWDDATSDSAASRPDEFRDAVALQFPYDTSAPGVCMGMRSKPVALWHWKADWQSDIDRGFRDVVDAYPNFWKDYYPFAVGLPPYRAPSGFASSDAKTYLAGWSAGNPLSDPARVSPVEELAALGFGTASHADQQEVLGRGVWKDGKWRVVVSRQLVSGSPDALQFQPGKQGFVSVAVWNGSNKEVGGRKQISGDLPFVIESAAAVAQPGYGLPWWAIMLVAAAGASVVGAIAFSGYVVTARRRART